MCHRALTHLTFTPVPKRANSNSETERCAFRNTALKPATSRSLTLLASMICFVVLVSAAHASVQVTMQGTLSTAGSVPNIAANDSFTAVLTYDEYSAPVNSSSDLANYMPYQFVATVQDAQNGSQTFYGDPTSFLAVGNNLINGNFNGDFFISNGTGCSLCAGFNLTDSSGTAFNSLNLPTALNLANFDSNFFAIVGNAMGSITALQVAIIQVPFSSFDPSATIQLNKGAFSLSGTFTLGTGSGIFAPARQPVQFQVGTFSAIIPAGSFTTGNGPSTYKGTINGAALSISITSNGKAKYSFTVKGTGADLNGTANPVPIGLAVGDSIGQKSINARLR